MERKRFAGLAFTAAALLSSCGTGATEAERTPNKTSQTEAPKSEVQQIQSDAKLFAYFLMNHPTVDQVISRFPQSVQSNFNNPNDRQLIQRFLQEYATCPTGTNVQNVEVKDILGITWAYAFFDKKCSYSDSGKNLAGVEVRFDKINGKPTPTGFLPLF